MKHATFSQDQEIRFNILSLRSFLKVRWHLPLPSFFAVLCCTNETLLKFAINLKSWKIHYFKLAFLKTKILL